MNIFKRTKVVTLDPHRPEEKLIKKAARIIKKGGLVAFPTETVYGLGADYFNNTAVKKLYRVKNRPSDKPLTLHISDVSMLEEFIGELPELARRLIKKFWPGPLTLILMSKDGRKLGFRMPKNEIASKLISECGTPIVAPSANLSGEKSPIEAGDISKRLGRRINMILDGGKTQLGVESTIIDTTVFPYRILREGAIKKAGISKAWYFV